MRKLILLALLAVAAITGGGAMATSADAASCSGGQSVTYWTGVLNFNAVAQYCDHVDKVHFRVAYWHDTTWGVNYGAFGNPTVYTVNVTGSQATHVFQTPAWCGGANHGVFTHYEWQIHNTSQNSWGNWYYNDSFEYRILC